MDQKDEVARQEAQQAEEKLDHMARLQARSLGFHLVKSRKAQGIDNLGGYQLVNADMNVIVHGERFDLSIGEVLDLLAACSVTGHIPDNL